MERPRQEEDPADSILGVIEEYYQGIQREEGGFGEDNE